MNNNDRYHKKYRFSPCSYHNFKMVTLIVALIFIAFITFICIFSVSSDAKLITKDTFDVIILDNISEKEVVKSIWFIPNVFTFNLVDNNSSRYIVRKNGVFPLESHLIIIYDSRLRDISSKTSYYGSINYYGQNPLQLSWVITHECLHHYPLDIDNRTKEMQSDIDAWYWSYKIGDWYRIQTRQLYFINKVQ